MVAGGFLFGFFDDGGYFGFGPCLANVAFGSAWVTFAIVAFCDAACVCDVEAF